MRYYIAAYCQPDSEEMVYKESGSGADLHFKFPEIKEVINRYHIKSIGITFKNGDRLRIYGANKARITLANLTGSQCKHNSIPAVFSDGSDRRIIS